MKRLAPLLLLLFCAPVAFADTAPSLGIQTLFKTAPKPTETGPMPRLVGMQGTTLVQLPLSSAKPALATNSTAGIVKIGSGITVTTDGTISAQQGQSGTIAIGTTTTGTAGSNATVTNSGTSTNAVLNFTIPRGPQGLQGIQGVQGVQGAAGGSTNWRGEYAPYTQYSNNDAVSYQGSSYIALTDVDGIAPPDPLYWNLLASKGSAPVKGVDYFDGAKGSDGYTPVKGVDYFDGAKGDKGDKGDTGAAGGTVAFKGAWSSVVNYVALDVVSYNGSSYVAKGPSLNVSPTVTASWQLMAQKGTDGTPGAQGQQGIQGVPGADGPNLVDSSTTTTYTGMLKGNGSIVQTATPNTDYLPATSPVVTTGITSPVYNTSSSDGSHVVNIRNTVTRTNTPQEGDMDTDASGKLWIYTSGSWTEKAPIATASVAGIVKPGTALAVDSNGVLSVMVNSLGPSGLVTAGLAGDQTISSGFAYVATATPWKVTFNSSTSSRQTTIYANYSGTVCAASGSKVVWANPVTYANISSQCAKLRTGTRATVQMQGGRTLATVTQNLQKANVPSASVSPTSLAFGSVGTGLTSTLTATLTNSGLVNLATGSPSITGTDAAKFAITANGCNAATVAPGATCTESVTFTPGSSAGGPYSAQLSIPHNASGSPTVLALTGTGINAINVLSYFNADSAATGQTLSKGTGTVTVGGSVVTTTAAVGSNALTSNGTANSGGRVSYPSSGNIDQSVGTMGFFVKLNATPVDASYMVATTATPDPCLRLRYLASSTVWRFSYRTANTYIDIPAASIPVGSYVFVELAWSASLNQIGYRVNGGTWTTAANATGTTPSGTTINLLNADANASNLTMDQIIISAGYKDDLYSVRNNTSF